MEASSRECYADLKVTSPIKLNGDGRCDSPGHNARYVTYTLVDSNSNTIVDFHIVQVSEVSSSNAMKKEGFQRCLALMKAEVYLYVVSQQTIAQAS